jgi:hypothetical protein
MTQTLSTLALLVALLATYAPAQAATRNACYIAVRARGQYVVQTAGTAGTIDVYVDGAYTTTVSRLNQLWYATADKDAVVRGYDKDGIVCG